MSDGQDLRPLTADELELVKAYALPPAASDGIVNKGQLAMALGVSETTIAQWLRKGLPAESGGTNGRAYEFRLSVAYAWNKQREASESANRARGDAVAAQLQLALLGGESADPRAEGGLTTAEQKVLFEVEQKRMVAARERGDLVRMEDVAEAMERMGLVMRDALNALPDRLRLECDLNPRQVEAAVSACDEAQRGVAAIMQGMANGETD